MADVFTRIKRSEVMSRIKSRGNLETELRLISVFRKSKIKGWRRNKKVFGKPDFIFIQKKLAIFVDGCFWHGCPKCYRRPQSNKKFWEEKVARNKARDRRVNRELRKLGWRVIRIWEHDLAKCGDACARRIAASLLNRQPQ